MAYECVRIGRLLRLYRYQGAMSTSAYLLTMDVKETDLPGAENAWARTYQMQAAESWKTHGDFGRAANLRRLKDLRRIRRDLESALKEAEKGWKPTRR